MLLVFVAHVDCCFVFSTHRLVVFSPCSHNRPYRLIVFSFSTGHRGFVLLVVVLSYLRQQQAAQVECCFVFSACDRKHWYIIFCPLAGRLFSPAFGDPPPDSQVDRFFLACSHNRPHRLMFFCLKLQEAAHVDRCFFFLACGRDKPHRLMFFLLCLFATTTGHTG